MEGDCFVKKEDGTDSGAPGSDGLLVKQEPGTCANASTLSSSVKQEVKPSMSTGGAKPVKVFAPDELRNALMPIWEQLEAMDEAIPFRVPVDPELLQIPVSLTVYSPAFHLFQQHILPHCKIAQRCHFCHS